MPQTLFNPRGRFNYASHPIASRLDSLHDKVLGVIDNGKVNADLFLDNIENLLCQTFDITTVRKIRKTRVGTPASFSQEFFRECDFVVNAFGD